MMRRWQEWFVGLSLFIVALVGCGGQTDTSSTSGSGTGLVGDGGMTSGTGGAMPGDASMGGPPMMGMMGAPDMGGAPGMSGAPGMGAQPTQPAPDEKQISEQRKADAARSIQEGDRLLAEGDFDGAINEYEIALVDDPENPSIKAKIARAKAIKAETRRREVAQLVTRGKRLFYQGEYVYAASTFEQALQKDPTHPQALAYLIAAGVAIKNLQNHGWPQPGLGMPMGQGDGQVGAGAMPGMMGSGSAMSGGMGMPGRGGMTSGMGGVGIQER